MEAKKEAAMEKSGVEGRLLTEIWNTGRFDGAAVSCAEDAASWAGG